MANSTDSDATPGSKAAAVRASPGWTRTDPPADLAQTTQRVAGNFLALSAAELVCRATSVVVTLSLARTLGTSGYGRIEFAFHIVFWLVLLVRDGFEVIAAREIARHPRLVRPIARQTLAMKWVVAAGLFGALLNLLNQPLLDPTLRVLLAIYGLMLLTTASGLDFVYRGVERMGRIAISLCLRTVIYAVGVSFCVRDAAGIAWVPVWLAVGEISGIALIWICYSREFGWPTPVLGERFLRVFAARGRSVLWIQVAQTMLMSVDLMLIGLLNPWSDVGLYGAPHRMVTAILTFGVIFQQVIFPRLSRLWRDRPESGRGPLDASVRILVMGMLPIAVGVTVLADPLVRFLLPQEYHGAGLLLAIGVWRAPLLTLAFLYQGALIAWNRESAGIRLLVAGAVLLGPMVLLGQTLGGLPGATVAPVFVGLVLVGSGYRALQRIGRQPSWHHHLARPILACLSMAVACRLLLPLHVLAAILGGAVVYFGTLLAVGGVRVDEIRNVLGRPRSLVPKPHSAPIDRSEVELAESPDSW